MASGTDNVESSAATSSSEATHDDSFVLPIPQKKIISVQYPGKVVNVDRALETLGGEENLSRILSRPDQRLPLRYRPKDAFCKPMYGNNYPTTNMLLKVTRKKKTQHSTKNDKSTSISQDEYSHAYEMIGAVDSTYKFEGMCDFQYLPMVTNADGGFTSIHDDIVPNTVEDTSFLEKEAPLYMLPTGFSRMDTPSHYLYQKDRTGLDPSLDENLIGKRRKKRQSSAYLIPFDATEIPTKANEEAFESIKRLKLYEEIETVKKHFNERPMWSKNALHAVNYMPPSTLKMVLPIVAYYFISGPWRTVWCKLGYDPRKEIQSRMYQVVDFRMRKKVLTKAKALIQPRSKDLYHVPVKPSRQRGISVPMYVSEEKEILPSMAPKLHSEASYILREDLLPAHYQMCYQFIDLQAEALKRIIEEAEVNTECDSRSGWWNTELCDKLRDKMSEIVEKTVSKILEKETKQSTEDQMEVEEEEAEEGYEDDLLDDDEGEDDDSDDEAGAELLQYLEPMDT